MKMKNVISWAILAIVLIIGLTGFSSALQIADNSYLKIDDTVVTGNTVALFAGSYVDLRFAFTSLTDESDVRIEASIEGYKKDIEDKTDRFDVVAGRVYTKTLKLYLPTDMDAQDEYTLFVRVASKDLSDEFEYALTLQRESYKLDILNVEYVNTIDSGDDVIFNVIIKNRGSHNVDDIFVTVKIPELGIQKTSYAGDLAPYDCDKNCSKDDAVEKNILVTIPSGTKAGTYAVEIKASDGDSSAVEIDEIEIAGKSASKGTGIEILSQQNLQDIEAGKEGEYTLTLLNTENEARTVTITLGTRAGLIITADPKIVTIPANEAKDIKITVATDSATQTGTYNVPLTISTDTDEEVGQIGITANVIKASGAKRVSLITITIILVIILIALILFLVLTSKSSKSDEEGNEYSGETQSETEETAYY
jgi:uncharacterized membrane protein